MKFLRVLPVVVLMLFSTTSKAQGLFPNGAPPLAHEVNGVWTAVNPNDPLTQDKSENALQLLERMNQGQFDLQLDVTQWGTLGSHAPLAQVIYELRFNQTADRIPLLHGNTFAWGLDNPNTAQEGFDILAERMVILEADFAAYVAAHP